MGTLTTRASAKELLGIASAVTAYDAVLDTLVAAVDGIVEDFCGRRFADTTYTDHFDGQLNQRRLLLPNYPIISVTSVHDDTDRVFGADTLVSADDYTFKTGEDSDGIIYFHATTLGRGIKNVKVVYRAGYATIPKPLARAADLIVASLYNRRKGAGRSSESLGNFSYSTTPEVFGDAMPLLARYRKWAEST